MSEYVTQTSIEEVESPTIEMLLVKNGVELLVRSGRLPMVCNNLQVGDEIRYLFNIPPVGVNPKEHRFERFKPDPTIVYFKDLEGKNAGNASQLMTSVKQGKRLIKRINRTMKKIEREGNSPYFPKTI